MVCIFVPVFLVLLLLIYVKIYPQLYIIIICIVIIYKNNIKLFLLSLNIIKKHLNNRNINKLKESSNIFFNILNLNHNFERLPSHPTIYVGNYPCTYLDSIYLTLLPNTTIIIGDNKITRNTWGKLLDDIIYRKQKNAYEDIKKEIQKKLLSGKSVFAYVTSRGELEDTRIFFGRIRTGIFRIANELGSTITPIAFDTIKTNMGCIVDQNFRIFVGETTYVHDVTKVILDSKYFFRNKIRKFKQLKDIYC